MVTVQEATSDEAQQTTDILQYVSHGGTVQLDIDTDLIAADGQVMLNQDAIEPLEGKGTVCNINKATLYEINASLCLR
jgi:hypothetical protein